MTGQPGILGCVERVDMRQAMPGDYDAIVTVANDWWARDVVPGLPRLFLEHFCSTSLLAETDGHMVGFLVGFLSPSQPQVAYIHYVAVDPERRVNGVARCLYDRFLAEASAAGCTRVSAITSRANAGSIAFHRRLGFVVSELVANYNGPGRDVVMFTRPIDCASA